VSAWVDRAAARRWFERAAAPGGADHLAREVEGRMAARLDYVRLAPARIVDIGSGASVGALRSRFPRAEIVAVDVSLARLRAARTAQPLARRMRAFVSGANEHFICADMHALPLAAGSAALVWSNLALAWADDLAAVLRECQRVLAVGGLAMFSTYGPDTLKELRAAFAAADHEPHVHPFVDMHDVGDALIAAGFADPVMDMETIIVTHQSAGGLMADLRATGERNALVVRRRGLTGRHRWQRMLDAYAAQARAGRVPATFEIVYGHAWKAAPRTTADGRAIVRLDLPPRRPGSK
jgi:malonyl-CoA O-methyltransferase